MDLKKARKLLDELMAMSQDDDDDDDSLGALIDALDQADSELYEIETAP